MPEVIQKWQSRGLTISKSFHHKDMYIIDGYKDGGFINISSSQDVMLMNHPVDKEIAVKRESFTKKLSLHMDDVKFY